MFKLRSDSWPTLYKNASSSKKVVHQNILLCPGCMCYQFLADLPTKQIPLKIFRHDISRNWRDKRVLTPRPKDYHQKELLRNIKPYFHLLDSAKVPYIHLPISLEIYKPVEYALKIMISTEQNGCALYA